MVTERPPASLTPTQTTTVTIGCSVTLSGGSSVEYRWYKELELFTTSPDGV